MQTYNVASSLGSAVADAESELLFGRDAEIGALRNCAAISAAQPVVAYLHGPAGAGKSALLRAVSRSLQAEGMTSLYLDAFTAGSTVESVARAIGALLSVPMPVGPGMAEAAASAIQAQVGSRGLLFTIDHYEEFVACDAWLRREILYRLGRGVCVVLAGRRGPDEAWPGDRAWRSILRPVPLREFTPLEAARFLLHCGVQGEAATREALRLAGTSPSLLAVVADAVSRVGGQGLQLGPADPGGDSDEVSRSSALIEQMLHPGSRRRTWRAGLGSSVVDKLLAAVCLLDTFDRESAVAMVGPVAVESAWAQLTRLRFIYPWLGRYRIHDTVRAALAAIVVRRRPWAQHRWRQQALGHLLGRAFEGDSSQDEAVAVALSAPRFGSRFRPQIDPGPKGSASPADPREPAAWLGSPSLAVAREPGGRAPHPLADLLHSRPDAFHVLRHADGALLGYTLVLPLVPDALDLAVGDKRAPVLRAWAERRGGNATRPTLVLWQVEVCHDIPGVRETLVADVLPRFRHHARILSLIGDPAVQEILATLGFRRDDDLVDGDTPLQVLDLDAMGGWPAWLRQLIQPPPDDALLPGRRRDAAQEALSALHEDERLCRTVAARYFAAVTSRMPSGPRVRAWLLDALASADLGQPAVPGRDLLHRYYVQRSGSHEAISEALGVARATYFRWHRLALDRLADSLFV